MIRIPNMQALCGIWEKQLEILHGKIMLQKGDICSLNTVYLVNESIFAITHKHEELLNNHDYTGKY